MDSWEPRSVVPDFCEAITAYRAFGVTRTGTLCSLNGCDWPARQPLHATCGVALYSVEQREQHPAPQMDCSCGIYAMKDAERLVEWWWLCETAGCYGIVRLWGRVIEHEHGYRAEYAYPGELVCGDLDVALRIEQRYGVPVNVFRRPRREPAYHYTSMRPYWRSGSIVPRRIAPPAPTRIGRPTLSFPRRFRIFPLDDDSTDVRVPLGRF
jgi:hypothetical protein